MRRPSFLIGGTALGLAAASRAATAAPAGAGLDGRTAIPVVRVRVAARELVLAIDTGDALSTLSPLAAAALGLRGTPVPNTQAVRATLSGVVLAGSTLRDHAVLVDDVTNWTGLVGFTVDGSLGYEAFRDRVVTIDYRSGRLIFPDTLPDGEQTPITWLKYHPRSPDLVTFDGLDIDGFPATAQFDTAMSKNAIVFRAKLPDLAVDNAPRAPQYSYEGAPLGPGRVGSIRIGTTVLAVSPVIYVAGADAHVPTTAIAAVVGDGLFARRAVTLDFPRSNLIVG